MATKRIKEAVRTKRCPDGRACAPIDFDAVNALGKRAKQQAAKDGYSSFRLHDQSYFIPDDYDVCDACLTAIYGLEAHYDHCDHEGMGPRHFDEKEVLGVLRKIRGETK